MRTFTVSQAKEVLPMLQREMDRLLPAYVELKHIWEEAAREHGLSVDDPDVRANCLQDERARNALEQVESSLLFFQEIGVECKGIEQGVFDFPCLVTDRLVYLCWQMAEDNVEHWHEIDVEYSGRKPLFELNRAGQEPEEMLLN